MVKERVYFNIKDKLVDCGIIKDKQSWWTGKQSIIVVAARRIGKTTSIWDLATEMWESSNYTKLLLYVRNSEEELKAFARTFNVDYKGKYLIQGTHIYKVTVDSDGKEHKTAIIGLVGAISTFSKLKSTIKNTNFHMVFYDEFNGMDTLADETGMQFFSQLNGDLYYYWTELLITIEGASPDLLAVITGNKVNAQNDILLTLGIEIPYDNNAEDIWTDRSVEIRHQNIPIWFLNGGSKMYEDIIDTHLLTSAFATYNPRCNAYYNENSFFQLPSKNVISRYNMVKDNPKYYFGFKKSVICLYEHETPDGETVYYFDEIDAFKYRDELEKVKIYPLDYETYITYKTSILWDDDDKEDIADQLTDWIKNEKVFFSSNWLKANVTIWLRNNNSYGV